MTQEQRPPEPPSATTSQSAVPAANAGNAELNPRFGYRHIRYSSNERERELQQKRADDFWQHARPNSVFVAAMGNHWAPGCWAAVMDMLDYTNRYGYYAAFEEIMDRCYRPYDSLGAMRNEAIMKAMEGYDWLLYVDNDVYPPPDALVRLISRDRTIIAPYIIEPQADPARRRPLHGPTTNLWTGVQPVKWAVLSMLLFRTQVFKATGPELWNDSIGADEGYHFQKTWYYGHRPYIDTELQVPVANIPTYPLATLRLSKEEHDDFWQKRRDRFLAEPDRRGPPGDPRVSELGEYLPFIRVENGRAQSIPDIGASGTSTPVAPETISPNGHDVIADKLAALSTARRMVLAAEVLQDEH